MRAKHFLSVRLPVTVSYTHLDFIKCQQQAIDIVSGNLLLLDAADLTLQFANLNFDFLYGVILLIIAALQVQNLSVIVGIIDAVSYTHLDVYKRQVYFKRSAC